MLPMLGKPLRQLSCAVAVLLASCNSLPPAARARLEVFDTYVETLAEQYPYFAQKHIDWTGLARAYRAAVVSAERPSQFYHLLTGLLSELDDPHVSLTVPAKRWADADGPATSLLEVPGFQLAAIDHHLRVFAWPDGQAPTPPAHLPECLRDYPEVTRIGGARVAVALLDNLLMGPPNSIAELQLCWADGTRTRHTLQRPAQPKKRTTRVQVEGKWIEVEIGHGRSLAQVASLREQGRFAVLQLATLDSADVDGDEGRFAAHLDALLAEADGREGLILDLRSNPGGRFLLMGRLLSRFLPKQVELVTDVEDGSWLGGLFPFRTFRSLTISPRGTRWQKPVVVLTSWRTASAAEMLARLLQREAGALVVGEQTIGAEAALEHVRGSDGTTLTFGKQRLVDVTGVGIQDEGVTPDVAVRLTVDDVRRCGSLAAARSDWEQRMLDEAERQLVRLAAAGVAK